MRLSVIALLACLSTVAAQEPAPATCCAPGITEELLARQPALIDAAVARFAQTSVPGAQVYFLGFAGYGEQRVFAEEIDLAANRIAQRYGEGTRTLRLVNDRRDVEKYPLATVDSLRHALKALGRVMDQDDVLFLALSSHGSPDATIAVSNPGMQPDDLSVSELADALEQSGIRWRVIVISACYSGSFIDKLADNQTIVLTAASRHRPSFGCSDDRHLTYFGEGFYRDALPASHNLREVFDATRSEIRRREKEERVRPSQPQAYFGPLMESKLEEMEAARYSSSVAPIR